MGTFLNPIDPFAPSGNPANAAASAANRQYKQQQGNIDYGLQEINAIFGGGTYPIYSRAAGAYNPQANYFTLSNGTYSPYTVPMTNHPFSPQYSGATQTPNISAAQSKIRKGQLYASSPSQNYQGFGPQFYNNYANAYINYATPQLAQQYQQTGQAIDYGLANRGIYNSSAAEQARNNLNLTMGQQQQQIADTAQSGANTLQQNVNAAKQQAISQLYQSANPGQAAQSALATASSFRAPNVFAPLANAFGGLVNQYATNQLLSAYNNPYMLQQSMYANPQTPF